MNQFINLVLYAGLTKEEFSALLPTAKRENAKNLTSFSWIMALFCLALAIANGFVKVIDLTNVSIYAGTAAGFVLLFAAAKGLLPRRPEFTQPLVYLFMAMLYGFSFAVTLRHPEYPAVTAIAVMLAVPFLFTDRPLHVILMSAAALTVFCALAFTTKNRELAKIDFWNGVTFTMVAVIAVLFQMKVKFRAYSQARKIQYLSEIDLLTGARNRNCYENSLEGYKHSCKTSVTCLYADVNGLHELNNQFGHKAGDNMLKTVAALLIERFGAENVYRIGGDEFVAFQLDSEDIQPDVRSITQALLQHNYHVSFGMARHEKQDLVMLPLTREAEMAMYEDKRQYYQAENRDRRKR